jgi:hypothetical protein
MKATLAPILLLLGASFAGCLAGGPTDSEVPTDLVGVGLFAPPSSEALWNDPQQFPHPDWNWPTLTHIPANAPSWWQPIAAKPLPDPVKGVTHLVQAGSGGTGDGIAVFGRLVVSPGGLIYDIGDPSKPEVLADMDVQPPARQAIIIPYPDGTLVAAFATGSGDIPLWDITDPRNPVQITIFDVPSGGNTIAVVPGTPILYNANAVGSRYYPHEVSGGRSIVQMEIYDLTHPDDPQLVQEWKNGYGCHMVSFYLNPELGKLRGYCAAVDATQIWDLTDPKNPTVISTIPMPHGADPVPGYPILAAVSHFAVVNDDATTLAVADEFMGGAAPACDVYYRTQGRTISGPAGNIYFYDITEEKEPVLRGWFNPGAHFTYNPPSASNPDVGSCTAHIGRLIPQAERDLLTMSFYNGGLVIADFTDPASPFIVDNWARAAPMDVWYHNGYLIAGDASNGIDILTLS